MLSHGCRPCAGRRASCCGRCSACCGCSRISISRYGKSAARIGCGNLSHLVVLAISNATGPCRRLLLGLTLAADAVLLTGLLDITGGPFNPFIVMYATYIWVAVVAVSPVWAVVVSLASISGFGWLVVDHLRAGLLEHHRLNDFPTHLFTMWFSGAGIAELVAHYVSRARRMLGQRQAQLDEARERAARSERLASLTTLAAGAAHELSTPLATIAVAARELERNAGRVAAPDEVGAALRDDARLVRSELDRCQSILDGMSGRANSAALTTSSNRWHRRSIARLAQDRLTDDCRQRLSVEIAPRRRTRPPQGQRWFRRFRRCSRTRSTRAALPTWSNFGSAFAATWYGSKYGTAAPECLLTPGGAPVSRFSQRRNRGRGSAWVCSSFARSPNDRVARWSSTAARARRRFSKFRHCGRRRRC